MIKWYNKNKFVIIMMFIMIFALFSFIISAKGLNDQIKKDSAPIVVETDQNGVGVVKLIGMPILTIKKKAE